MPSENHAPRALAVRVGGVMMLAGGVLAASTAILPPPAEGSETVILAASAIATAFGLWLLLRRPRLDDRALGTIAVIGTALITIATHQGGESGGTADNEILFLWVCLYAFYFLALPYAVAQIGIVGAAYGFLLLHGTDPVDEAVTRWLVTMTTLVVAGVVISRLRSNLYRTVDDLSDRARHDGLTGLLNRSGFDERFMIERSRSLRDGSSVSVLAIDVDGFKAINDAYGHASGDIVLRRVAVVLGSHTRGHDSVGRFGGDEFAVLLSGIDEHAAQAKGDELRQAMSQITPLDGQDVTVSIGVATSEAPLPPFDELWRAADEAMYVGKHAGGDRVCVSAPIGPDQPAVAPAA